MTTTLQSYFSDLERLNCSHQNPPTLSPESERILIGDKKLTCDVINMGAGLFDLDTPASRNPVIALDSRALAAEVRAWLVDRDSLELPICGKRSTYALRAALGHNVTLFSSTSPYNKIVLPLFSAAHWSVMVIEKTTRSVTLYDSLGSAHSKYASSVLAMLENRRLLPMDYVFRGNQLRARQPGCVSCGYVALSVMAHLSPAASVRRCFFNPEDVGTDATLFRERTMAALLALNESVKWRLSVRNRSLTMFPHCKPSAHEEKQ